MPVRPVAAAKLAAFRAHRTQTELDEWLWGEDAAGVQHLAGGVEWFEQVNRPFVPDEIGLCGLHP